MLSEVPARVLQIPRVMAAKYGSIDDPEEIESIANLELVRALNSFEEGKGMSLANWVYYSVKQRVFHYFNSADRRNRLETQSINYNQIEGAELASAIEDRRSLLEESNIEARELVERHIGRLSPIRRKIVTMWSQGIMLVDIAPILHMSYYKVRKHYREAMVWLKLSISNSGNKQSRRIMHEWRSSHPKEAKEAARKGSKKGTRNRLRNLINEKKRYGWVKLQTMVCKALSLMTDGKERSIYRMAEEIGVNPRSLGNRIPDAVKLGYLSGRENDPRSHVVYYRLTELGLKERWNV